MGVQLTSYRYQTHCQLRVGVVMKSGSEVSAAELEDESKWCFFVANTNTGAS